MFRDRHIARTIGLIADRLSDTVLAAVALGTLTLATQMVYDLALDFINQEPHPLHYMVSELMFVLIVMELFRQVVRQICHEPFSLNPFIAIAVIASVRGLLVAQMKLGVGDLDWGSGSLVMLTFTAIIVMLVVVFLYYRKFSADHPRVPPLAGED